MSFYDEILSPVFGSKPQIAGWTPLDLSTEQGKSVTGNLANFDQISQLGAQYQKYLLDQQNKLLPGFSETLASGEKGAQQLLSTGEQFLTGELPPDVISALQRSDAYKAFSGGFGGSQMSSALGARDLGLTSLDLMKQGANMIGQGGNSAQQWAQMANQDIMNPASMFVTPQQTGAFDMQNAILTQQALQNKYNVEAAPDPVAAGISNTLMSVLGMYMGGGFGGGGGGGGLSQGGKTSFNVPVDTGWQYSAMGLG